MNRTDLETYISETYSVSGEHLFVRYPSFADCTGLYTIYLPAAVRQIETAAFRGCDSLVEFNVDSGNMVFCTENGALMTRDRTVFIQLPADANYTDYVIPETVTRILEGAFYGCHKLYSVTIPGSVSKIEELTFCGCSGLTEIVIPMSVRTIRASAFTEKAAEGGEDKMSSTALKKIHYGGLEDWFYSISIGEDNDNLYNAALYFVDPWDMPQSVVDYFETQIR